MANSWEWLDQLFGSTYDLYYLDSLATRIPISQSQRRLGNVWSRARNWRWKKKEPVWYMTDLAAIDQLAIGIRKTLGLKNPKQYSNDSAEDTLPEEFLKDYGKQNQAAKVIVDWLAKAPPGGISSKRQSWVEEIADRTESWSSLPNRQSAESLVVIDGVISSVDSNHPALYNSVMVTPEMVERRKRVVRFCLSSLPWPLIGLESERIGLMIDPKCIRQTYANENSDASDPVACDGWYPFAKVLGYWRVERGGRNYIDTLAILIRTWPPMDRILKVKAGTQRKIVFMLDSARRTIDDARSEFDSSGKYENRRDDNRILYPLLLANLCCHLNHIDWSDLRNQAPDLHDAFDKYWKNLSDFSKKLDGKTESMLPNFVTHMKKGDEYVRGLLQSGVS